MSRPRPIPPYPNQIRQPISSFGWLETSLLHDGILAGLRPEAISVLLLLALAADEKGASYYGRGKMGAMLGMDMESVTNALRCLLDHGLVGFRPWRPGLKDGVWQLLPVKKIEEKRQNGCHSLRDIMNRLGRDRKEK